MKKVKVLASKMKRQALEIKGNERRPIWKVFYYNAPDGSGGFWCCSELRLMSMPLDDLLKTSEYCGFTDDRNLARSFGPEI